MVSDGQLKVGMAFGTVKSACAQVAEIERKLGGKVTSRNKGTVGGFYGEKSGNQVDYTNNGKLTVYHATIGGRHYSGQIHSANLKNNDAIMQQRFTQMSNAEGTQVAIDKNHNGVIDKGEIEDRLWPDAF